MRIPAPRRAGSSAPIEHVEGRCMDILYLLIPLSVVMVLLIGAIFWWSLSSGQFDDVERAGQKILEDDQ
jgi:cbb3-type cytochrome oxidase maturation protein